MIFSLSQRLWYLCQCFNIYDKTVNDIDEIIAKDMVLTYHTYTKNEKTDTIKWHLSKLAPNDNGFVIGRKKICRLSQDRTLDAERSLTFNDLALKVSAQKGQIIEKDVTYDIEFMMENICHVGEVLRKKMYSFLPNKSSVYLFIDNTWGHGKIAWTDIKNNMKTYLKRSILK